EGIKSAVSIPVAGGTQVQDIEVAAEAVASGKCDMVYMARANIADPELANKAKAGKLHEIKPCINCCRCQESADDPPVYCSVNPRVGREAEYPSAMPEPAEVKKKVLVIGGGPSGMEAARVAALKGHNVTIVDENYQLGGAMLLASIANPKMGPQMRYKIKEVEALPINIKLSTEVTPEFVKQFNPDTVVLAVGGAPKLPDVPGIDKTIVRSRTDMQALFGAKASNKKKDFLMTLALPFVSQFVKYFYNPDLFRKLLKFDFVFIKNRPALLGGGFAGLEMGELLLECGKKPTIIEETPYFGSDFGPITRWVFKKILRDHNVPMYSSATIKEITDEGIKIDIGGETQFIDADAVIPTNITKNTVLYDQIKDMVKEIHATGDGNDPGKLMEAITSGFIAGNKI
ncbi:MAG: FAD-dependent oxidoreductase, partial [Desulfobacteraceae bacterium]|nr:FAD-dependent oxidoreductase [Desulfobacteraceae bacterium]